MSSRSTKFIATNYKYITGLRVKEPIDCYTGHLETQIRITPEIFLVRRGRSVTRPFFIYGTNQSVHVPHSLCRRAKIMVNDEGKICARSAMYTSQPAT